MENSGNQPNKIKAIETFYNGYKFRSRLEARWAVFFDAIKVKYEYEKEGYDLEGTLYLPDFYLPDLNCFVEIKGSSPTDEEEDKATLLAKHSQKDVFVFWGEIPYPNPDEMDADSAFAHFKNGGWDNLYKWCQCSKCGKFGITFDGRADRLPCKNKGRESCPKSNHGDKGYNTDSADLEAAYLAARSARFEHGAKG